MLQLRGLLLGLDLLHALRICLIEALHLYLLGIRAYHLAGPYDLFFLPNLLFLLCKPLLLSLHCLLLPFAEIFLVGAILCKKVRFSLLLGDGNTFRIDLWLEAGGRVRLGCCRSIVVTGGQQRRLLFRHSGCLRIQANGRRRRRVIQALAFKARVRAALQ